jgi:hypothetical protein
MVNWLHITGVSNREFRQSSLLDSSSLRLQNTEALRILVYFAFYATIAYYENDAQLYLPARHEDYHRRENYLFRSFNILNSVFEPFFFLYYDHLSQHLILSIRGTESLTDTITDAVGSEYSGEECIGYVENEDGEVVPFKAHEGFCRAAKGVIEKVLKFLFEEKSRFPEEGVEMMITGHSYGAGTASLVAYSLKQELDRGNLPRISSVRAILFATPPSFSANYIRYTCGYITSVVLGWDIVPTASTENVYRMLCPQAPNPYSGLYIPGNVMWLTYDDITEKVEGMYLIPNNSERLTNITIHHNMGRDHGTTAIYAYLVALITTLEKDGMGEEMEVKRKSKK